MEALFQSFLALFDPLTSPQVLAVIGLVTLSAVVLLLLAAATAEAATGLSNVITGLGQFVVGLIILSAAVGIALLAVGLAHGTLVHIRH